MGAVSRTVQAGAFDPAVHNAGVLARRNMRLVMKTAWKEVFVVSPRAHQPILDRHA
jgi:hypothetical protein